ncbi:MAG: 2-oxoglutarate dehydrogenase E1 component [Deltaproteobacteria bacterium]|nr:2-oxoglutarate dehydrogenase E1 component [Deltaproteobacteria bacterium]
MARPPSDVGAGNLPFVEELYHQFMSDPNSVDEEWRVYFTKMIDADNGHAPRASNGSNGSMGSNGRHGSTSSGSLSRPDEADAARRATAEGRTGESAVRTAGVGESYRRLGTAVSAGDELGSSSSATVALLRRINLFEGAPDAELREVAAIAEPVSKSPGDVIVREGDMGRDLFIVVRGHVMVRRASRVVAELGAGDVVGEMAVLDHQPRSADAVARSPVELLRIHGDDLLPLMERRPALARGVIRVLTRRLRDSGARQDRVDQLIRAYRVRGHLIANLNPLGLPNQRLYEELNPAHYGFSPADHDMVFSATTIPGANMLPFREIIAHLRRTYCREIGIQFMHIDDLKIKMWLQNRMESTQNTCKLSPSEQVRILTKLTDAEIFEQFIHRKFVGAKRFSLEGAESLIPLLDMAIEKAGEHGVEEVVIGMPHRGRLNVLANILGKSPRHIFREFDDRSPELYLGRGDVKYHLGYSNERVTACGQRVHMSLTFNPSHLEFVGPVVLGRVRAKQDQFGDLERRRGMGILIHGDAAFAGQGVVQELLNMSELGGYTTGGTLHIIVNNQIGFTTTPAEGRSSQYCTDVAKMLQIPLFHVNGEHPEAVAQAIRLAMEFREEFKKDVVIDMYCYRRHGHNEGDEPSFTQPLLYKAIRRRKSVREGYIDNLVGPEGITREEAAAIEVARREILEAELGAARSGQDVEEERPRRGYGRWHLYRGGRDIEVPDVSTSVPKEKLQQLLTRLTRVPYSMSPHPKISKMLEARLAMAKDEAPLDWAAGEALAFASLLVEGHNVRLSGQDSARGTFSHRHAVLFDVEDGKSHVPLQHLTDDQGVFEVFNSPLCEIGVLGFEYGYSLEAPDSLVVWEAQFGDFANVAQVVFDQFISSGEDKWSRLSGLTMLLPHGFEGQGPEHSSARLERFLNSGAEDNIQVVNPTTPAQLFHLLRRQVLRAIRKPLVVMSPKSLLRHPMAVSPLDDLAERGFQRIIPDVRSDVNPSGVRRILLTSGKVYYELEQQRAERGAHDIAILRVEQYYPFDSATLKEALALYPTAAPLFWVQEEPRNMGAWNFLRPRLEEIAGDDRAIRCVARPESASPATGSASAHKQEQALLMIKAFGNEG